MTRLLLQITITLAALLSAAVFLIRAQPQDVSALRTLLTPPPGCASPCFMGIRPGVTSLTEARIILHERGWVYYPHANQWRGVFDTHIQPTLTLTRGGDVVTHISIGGMSLGDIQMALGQPSRIILYHSVAHGAKPYDLIYPQYSLYVLVDLYICELSQNTLWHDPAPVTVHIANALVNRYDTNPNFFISAEELDLHRWAEQLRNINSCKGEKRS
ncbi:MAG: hypothetical protein K8I30_09820 [Anaerolineae bacterium]|nr:hypothetical protein [Anaerolineae bacterium]